MSRKIRIAIVVEVKKRELPFMCILREVLKQKEYEVKLIPFRSLCTWRILAFRPDVVLVNGLRHEFPYAISQMYLPKKLFGAKIVCYYSEQVGWYEESLAKTYYNKVIFDNVDYHLSWGNHFAEELISLGVNKEKVWIIGSIQYDIDKYLTMTNDAVKRKLSSTYGLPYERKWIMYADNLIDEFPHSDYYPIRRKDSYEYIKACAVRNPDAYIIIRPHPETPKEQIESTTKVFEKYDNIKIISDGHIFDWTYVLSAMIIWNSTSSIQAMFLSVPVFGFITSDGMNMEEYWYKDIFPTYTNPEDMANDIAMKLNRGAYNNEEMFEKNKEKYITDWYLKKDGLSFDRLCQIIGFASRDNFNPLTKRVQFSLGDIVKILYYELRAWIGDIVKNRSLDKNICRKEVQNELSKYDITRFEGKEFEIVPAEYGNYLL